MNDKRTIILVDNSLFITGSIHSTLQTIDQLKSYYRFVIVLPERSVLFPLVESHGYKVIGLPMLEVNRSFRILGYIPALIINTFRLIRIARKEKADIVHVNDIYNMLGVMTSIVYRKVKFVYYVRLLRTSYIRPMYNIFAYLVRLTADHIICVSGAVQKDIGNPIQSQVIYTTFIWEELPPWEGIKDSSAIRVLYLANFIPGKGHILALSAIGEVVKKHPGIRLTFVGGTCLGVYDLFKKDLMTKTSEMGLSDNIHFQEETSEVEKLMKSFDLVLNLSESESFSMICLEAISYGVPLIVSDCGGPAEITDHGKMALLVPNKDYYAAALAINHSIEHPGEAEIRAADAKVYSRRKFNPLLAVEKLKQIYG